MSRLVKKITWTILLMFTLLPSCYSQTQKIDSLKVLLPTVKGGERIDVLFNLSREFLDLDKPLGLYYGKIGFVEAKQFGDSLRIVKLGRIYGQAFRRLSKTDSALLLFEHVAPIAKRHNYREEMKHILNGIALVYYIIGKYDKALECYFEAVELKKLEDDKLGLSVTFNNIGLVYQNLKDYDKALNYFKQSLELKNNIKSKFDLDILLFNIGQCYSFIGNFEEAKRYVNKGFSACVDCPEDSRVVGLQTLGYVAFFEKNYNEAKKYFSKAYIISKDPGDEKFLIESIQWLVKIAIKQNRIPDAENYLREAEALISSGTPYNLEMVQVFHQLQSWYARSKDYRSAYYYQNRYVILHDSIYSFNLTNNLMKIEAQHLEKENKSKIEAQNKILALNEEVMIRQKYLNAIIGFVALLLFALAFALYRNNRQKQRINLLLDTKVKERTLQLEVSRNLLQHACDERDMLMQKTAQEVKQRLTTIKGLCLVGKRDIDSEHRYLEKVSIATDDIFDAVNNLSQERTIRGSLAGN